MFWKYHLPLFGLLVCLSLSACGEAVIGNLGGIQTDLASGTSSITPTSKGPQEVNITPTSKGPQEVAGILSSLLKNSAERPEKNPVTAARLKFTHLASGQVFEAQTNGVGQFNLGQKLPDGDYLIRVEAQVNGLQLNQNAGRFTVSQGLIPGLLDVVIGTGAIQGRITLEGKRDHQDITVAVANTSIPSVTTNSAGEFTIYNIPPEVNEQEQVQLMISKANYEDISLPLPEVQAGKLTLLQDRLLRSKVPYSKTAVVTQVLQASDWLDPADMTADADGNLYLVDAGRHQVFKLSPSGRVQLLAGTGQPGLKNGLAGQAQFNQPSGIAIDHQGNLYIADTLNDQIRKITPTGQVSTYAGGGESTQKKGWRDGSRTSALFYSPRDLEFGPDQRLYIVDSLNHCIRKIDATGQVETLAGQPYQQVPISYPSVENIITYFDTTEAQRFSRFEPDGFDPQQTDGPGSQARFYYPQSLAINSQGTLFVLDEGNQALRQISAAGEVSTWLSLRGENFDIWGDPPIDGEGMISHLALDQADNLYLSRRQPWAEEGALFRLSPSGQSLIVANVFGAALWTDGQEQLWLARDQSLNKVTLCEIDKSSSECRLTPQYLTPLEPRTFPGPGLSTPPETPPEFVQYWLRLTVEVTNRSRDFSLSPGLIQVGGAGSDPLRPDDRLVHLFTPGLPDFRQGLEALAEDGSLHALNNYFLYQSGSLFNLEVSPQAFPDDRQENLKPGERWQQVYEFPPMARFPHLHLVLKLMESNDTYIAPLPEGVPILSPQAQLLQGDISAAFRLWDLGSEINQPLGSGSHQPARQKAFNIGPDEQGVVHEVHDPSYPAIQEMVKISFKTEWIDIKADGQRVLVEVNHAQ